MAMRLLLLLVFAVTSLPLAAQLITRNFLFNSYNRIYDLELPTSYAPGDRLPLVLDLHYLGQDGRGQDTLTDFFLVADTANFIICHPWGQSTNWNVGFNAPYASGDRDVGFISAVIDSIDAEFGVDRQRIYVTGMGQGGFMAHRLACELSGKIAAMAAVGASITDSAAFYCAPIRPVPVMLIHGTADSVIPYAGNPGFWPGVDALVDFWLDKNGCPNSVRTTTAYPNTVVADNSTVNRHHYACNSASEVVLYEVVNGGFTWPGHNCNLLNGGVVNLDLPSSVEIWNFFRQWSLSGPVNTPAPAAPLGLQIGPNPVHEGLYLRFDRLPKGGYARLIDLSGKEIYAEEIAAGNQELRVDLANVPAGMYLLRLEAGAQFTARRIVRQ